MAPGKGQEVCEGQHGAEHYSRTSCLLWLHRHLPHLWDPELNVKNGCKAKTRERTHVWTEERLERESGRGRSRREDTSQRRPASSPLSLSGDSGQGLRPAWLFPLVGLAREHWIAEPGCCCPRASKDRSFG